MTVPYLNRLGVTARIVMSDADLLIVSWARFSLLELED
jgi:hypothetical protein